MKLKVCGLTDLDQIQEIISLTINYLGFIFYEKSPRYVLNKLTLKQIAEIPHFNKVGVFVNESIKVIAEIVSEAQLNWIQLHGDESGEYITQLKEIVGENIQIIKVIRIGRQSAKELQETISRQPSTVNYFLFDTDSNNFGGTGKTFDWQILNTIEIPKPYFLSGGISQENIIEINKLKQHPFALDINSKFEIEPGNKDVEKIKQFYEQL